MTTKKTPNVDSASVTARTISRLMRKAGFLMANTSDRYRWTEGFYVSRVGCSSSVDIGYHHENRLSDNTAAAILKRCKEWDRLDAWLKEKGYQREEGPGHRIKCKYPG